MYTIDAWSGTKAWYIEELLPAIKEKTMWLRKVDASCSPAAGRRDPPHEEKQAPEILTSGGRGGVDWWGFRRSLRSLLKQNFNDLRLRCTA